MADANAVRERLRKRLAAFDAAGEHNVMPANVYADEVRAALALLDERDATIAERDKEIARLNEWESIQNQRIRKLLGERDAARAEVEALRADAMRADRGTPHKCPRCDGKGGWNDPSGSSVMGIWRACQTCMGSGVLWSRAAIAEQEKGK